MNVRKRKNLPAPSHVKLMWTRGTQGMVVLALTCTAAWGQDVRTFVNTGNQHYQASDFSEALNRYEQALTENPQAYRARFNQGNVYYRLDDLEEALKAYREVAAETKDMALVARAKYNLGNTHFQQGLKQQDSDLQKALTAMRDSITQWRSALELNPENVNAARNIEVARLKIKDILDQINKQQQDPNQPQQQDPNQAQQQDPEQQQESGDDQQQQDQAGQDPNQPQDPNESQDPNQPQESPPPEQPEPGEPQNPQQDMTAQAILDKEQKQKDQRRQQQVMQKRPVDKDW